MAAKENALAGSHRTTLEDLRGQLRKLERTHAPRAGEYFSSGCAGLDGLHPDGGFPPGSLIEWIGQGGGSGGAMLALLVARQACGDQGACVVIDRGGEFYAPAAAALGMQLDNLLVVEPANARDEQWAIDQALRCVAVTALWARVERTDSHTFRRWQLAAETGGCLGCFVRPADALGQPSWADLQLLVSPLPSRRHRLLRVTVTRCRGGAVGQSVLLKLDETTGVLRSVKAHDTHSLHLAAQLADPTARQPTARAC